LGCEYDGFGLELKADPMAIARVKEHLVGEGPFVGIAPGAAFGPSKRWPVERFAAVADRLSETGAQCVLLTGPGEEDTRDAIRKLVKRELLCCDEGRPTIDTLKATVSLMNLLVCNDSGPRHVAIAMGVPAVCVMGPTRPVYTEGPYETGRVLRIDVDCGPCQKPTCATDHRCMTGISPEAVFEAALTYLPKARV
jgi:heptosyltransferase-2